MLYTLDLIKKGKFREAYYATLSGNIKKISKNLWQYHCLKEESDLFRSQMKNKLNEPTQKSDQYKQIKQLLKGQNKKIGQVHQEYEEALRQILSFNAERKDFDKIP